MPGRMKAALHHRLHWHVGRRSLESTRRRDSSSKGRPRGV